MAVDCMTKNMSGEKMRELMSTGKLNLNASPESIIAKMKKQKANKLRRIAAVLEKEAGMQELEQPGYGKRRPWLREKIEEAPDT